MKYCLIFLLFLSNYAMAQKIDSINLGSINLYQPSLLKNLMKTHKAVSVPKPEMIVRGYAIQIMNSTNRTSVIDAKSKFLSMYPNIKTDLIYQVPYYRLHVGEYVERKDAEGMLNKLRGIFSECFIVRQDLKIKQTIKEKEKEPKLSE